MKKLRISMIAVCIAIAGVALAKEKAKKPVEKAAHAEAPEISLTDLKTMLDHKEAITLIDANGEKSYKSGHIPGAIHFAKYEEKNNLKEALPPNKNALIVAYCGGPLCTAWEAAAAAAKKEGYTNIRHLKAGIKGWKDAKYATES